MISVHVHVGGVESSKKLNLLIGGESILHACSLKLTLHMSFLLRAGPHPGVAARYRCCSRYLRRSGARIRSVQTEGFVGLSEGGCRHGLAGKRSPGEKRRTSNRRSEATLGVGLDETAWRGTNSVHHHRRWRLFLLCAGSRLRVPRLPPFLGGTCGPSCARNPARMLRGMVIAVGTYCV